MKVLNFLILLLLSATGMYNNKVLSCFQVYAWETVDIKQEKRK